MSVVARVVVEETPTRVSVDARTSEVLVTESSPVVVVDSSLVGPSGPIGVSGPEGPVGPQGPQGEIGLPGDGSEGVIIQWFSGQGPPPAFIAGAKVGSMYVDERDGGLYQL